MNKLTKRLRVLTLNHPKLLNQQLKRKAKQIFLELKVMISQSNLQNLKNQILTQEIVTDLKFLPMTKKQSGNNML